MLGLRRWGEGRLGGVLEGAEEVEEVAEGAEEDGEGRL